MHGTTYEARATEHSLETGCRSWQRYTVRAAPAHINIETALQPPVAESLRQIHQLDKQLAASPQQAEPALEETQRRQMV